MSEEVEVPELLTPIERRIYGYLVDHLKRETYQPSIREIGARFGIRSTKTVTEHLQSLQRKGYLDRLPSRSRALKLIGLDLSPRTYTIPVYGHAGDGLEEPEGRYDLDQALACAPDCYLVRVSGDHLREHGIRDGDLVLVAPCSELEDGEVGLIERQGRIELEDRIRPLSGEMGGAPDGPDRAGTGRCLGAIRALLRTYPGG